mmetsp:Transcript_354/g.489  ORF Transcript_354/g.489 Transcript_354/m.489 type:complete len:100 (+) Transcript_354:253-552(+)
MHEITCYLDCNAIGLKGLHYPQPPPLISGAGGGATPLVGASSNGDSAVISPLTKKCISSLGGGGFKVASAGLGGGPQENLDAGASFLGGGPQDIESKSA